MRRQTSLTRAVAYAPSIAEPETIAAICNDIMVRTHLRHCHNSHKIISPVPWHVNWGLARQRCRSRISIGVRRRDCALVCEHYCPSDLFAGQASALKELNSLNKG